MRRSFCGSHRDRVEAAAALGARRRRRISLELEELERPGGRALMEESPEVEAYLAALSVQERVRPRRASLDCPRGAHPLDTSPKEDAEEGEGEEAEVESKMSQPRASSSQPRASSRRQQPLHSRTSGAQSQFRPGPEQEQLQRQRIEEGQEEQEEQGAQPSASVLASEAGASGARESSVTASLGPQLSFRKGSSQGTKHMLASARKVCASLVQRAVALNQSSAANSAAGGRSGSSNALRGPFRELKPAPVGNTGLKGAYKETPLPIALPGGAIHDTWAGDGKLGEWVDWAVVDTALRPPDLMQAQAALISGSRRAGQLLSAAAGSSKS